MSTAQRRPAAGVIPDLLARPQAYDLFQAVRLLERWLSSPDDTGLKRISFINSMSLSFPTGDIEQLSLRCSITDSSVDSREPAPASVEGVDLTTPALSLLGVAGALPLHYTEALLQFQRQHRDDSARAFMDVFSHRAVMLFYEAWRKNQLALHHERRGEPMFLSLLLSMAGVSAASGRRQWHDGSADSPVDHVLAYHAGQLQQRTVSAGQLEQLLLAQFRVPVKVEQFIGGSYVLPLGSRFHLGRSDPDSVHAGTGLLGRSAMLGERMWQRDLRVRLVLGPLRRVEFGRFLPGGKGARALRQLLMALTGPSLDYEVKLSLDAREVTGCTLHGQRPHEQGRLGWDTFMVTKPVNCDRDDVRYTIDFST